MQTFNAVLDAINTVLWHEAVLYTVLLVGLLFTIWSGFGQYRSLTHGVAVIRGKYDDKRDPGAINHFQALSTALSGTVGLGNIGGVAVAVAMGGPGAVFWMWVVAAVGMMIKTTEVTLAMLYRNTDDPENPHGGSMWVAQKGFEKWGMKGVGVVVAWIFCITLIISTITGGNMFQVWNVSQITTTYFPGVPRIIPGIIICVLVGMTVLGGIKRIGAVTGRLVPFMCVIYLLGAIYVLVLNFGSIPAMFRLIFASALPDYLGGSSADASGAFLGGTFGYAFLWGMKRALFSNEAGQGSSPIAHSAAKTDEPVREGVVAGLEPFIDTLVVCTLTALVVLSTGAWNREAAANFERPFEIVASTDSSGAAVANMWIPSVTEVPAKSREAARISNEWRVNDGVFVIVRGEEDKNTGRDLHTISGKITGNAESGLRIQWVGFESKSKPEMTDTGLYMDLMGASLTGHAFDRAQPGLGMWVVTIAAWLFAISTIISWYYYGEQGMIFMLGQRSVLPYKIVYCLLILVASMDFIRTEKELDSLTSLGTGVMLFANIPIMLIFGSQAMAAYKNYGRRLKSGELDQTAHAFPTVTDVVEGKDVK